MLLAEPTGKNSPFVLGELRQRRVWEDHYVDHPTRKNHGATAWTTALDYGCGKGGTADWLEAIDPQLTITRWTPNSPTLLLDRYDWLYSIDSLEFNEEIDARLDHLFGLADQTALVIVVDLNTSDDWINKIELTSTHVVDSHHVESTSEGARLCITTHHKKSSKPEKYASRILYDREKYKRDKLKR